ncbi:MAG: hypothetical protein A3F22_00795 [Candidatus Magasanikbacteria bacterium RIFCSPHIGHO2_12_FULL_41_16]|uniref:Multidrug ABC transporter substrate-binding protein n=1 Tax=Candidatus Magasanikbacteria bacterium RIFCSPLOWO2_01_FULL_40_15 TaxID=1798686 RepID=A0A1F6N041_9BACT|nr:MAG: hypothetical protein A2794_02710 [Alphaproteobacteria bacterium RIFCSPHIGHO2_01_FULL_40_8]OGH74758.1 MAG: hypothetical protein A3F22_00795 [Candidatus Magasanikbacteria bacterium RIFCSPHIGHO2_12_FULL_41_16]OGH77252.1 MAG: hypothetical protein A2983_03960 [Candidatus Magasanikbacteria bacterium RIFCSPLOWO2_01_FULL_40_15]
MRILEYIPSSWRLIKRNRVRSFLTMLGIIIGVMSIVVIMSVGAGAQGLILNQVKSLGSNLVGVLPGKSDNNGPPAAVFGIVVTTLTTDDLRAILSGENSHIISGTAYVRGADIVTSGETQISTSFVGVQADYPKVEDVTIKSGQFFTAEDDRALGRLAVLGSEAARELFGDNDPIGRSIKIKRTNFLIIGVIKERGVSGFQNQDNQIFVPITTAQKLLLGVNHVSFMRFKIDAANEVENSLDYIRAVLREQHNIANPDNDDFSVRSANQGLDALTGITNALRFFLAAIAAISLIVGGIGIMNIMLAAVEERTKEIGLRKALGATRTDIANQFLVETIMITLSGGITGIIFGTLISASISQIAQSQGYTWDLIISPWSIFIGCIVSITIGLIFGISPARRASHLNPIEALRYE